MIKIKSPEWVFSLLVFFIGLFLLLITPMGANTDEETYVARIWEMSLGGITPNSLYSQRDFFPNVFFENSYRRDPNHSIIDFETWKQQGSIKIDFTDWKKYSTRATYFPVLYAIQALIIGCTNRLFDFPILYSYYFLRLSYLLSYTLLIFLAIKIIPFGKWIFGLVLTLPICIIQAASVSSDGLIFGIAFLFIAWIIRLSQFKARNLTKKELLITCALILSVGMLKPNFIGLFLLLFLIPKNSLNQKYFRPLIIFCTIVSIFISLSWSFLISSYYLDRSGSSENTIIQIKSFFTNPFDFIELLFNSLKSNLSVYLINSLGVSGYNYWNMPSVVYYLIPIGVVLALFCEKEKINFSLKERGILFLSGLVNLIIVFIIFYIVETSPESSYIWGVQGRYFTPFYPLLILPFIFQNDLKFPTKLLAFLTMIAITGISAISLFLDYHVVCGEYWLDKTSICVLPNYKNWDPGSNLDYTPGKGSSLKQEIHTLCNNVSQLRIWVNQIDQTKGGLIQVELTDIKGNKVESIQFSSKDIQSTGYYTLNFNPITNSKDKHYLLTITSNQLKQPGLLSFGYTQSSEYPDNGLLIDDVHMNGDLVFQYSCLTNN